MTGTASEMNAGSVITNEEVTIKTGRVYGTEVNPKFSIICSFCRKYLECIYRW